MVRAFSSNTPSAAAKRPASAFALFVKETFAQAKQANPGAAAYEVMKVVSGNWKLLAQEAKEKYVNESKALREEYDQLVPKETRAKIARFKGDKPVKSVYALFYKKMMREHKLQDGTIPFNLGEFQAKVSEMWKALGQDERQSLEKEFKALKEEFVRQNPDAQVKFSKLKSEGARKLSSYTNFVKQNYTATKSEHPELKAPELLKALSKKWNALTAEEKDSFKI